MSKLEKLKIAKNLIEAQKFIEEEINPKIIEKNSPWDIDSIIFEKFKDATNNGTKRNVEKIKYACKILEHCEFSGEDGPIYNFHTGKGFQLFKTSNDYYGNSERIDVKEIYEDIERNGIEGPYKFPFTFIDRDHYQHGIVRGHIEFDPENSAEGNIYIDRIDVLN